MVDIFGSVLQVFVLTYFFNRVLSYKRNASAYKTLTSILCIGLYVLVSTFMLTSNIAPALFLGIVLLYCFLLFEDKFIKKVLYSLLIYVLGMMSEFVVGLILSYSYDVKLDAALSNTYFYLQGIIISKLLLFFIFRIVGLFEYNNKIELNIKSLISVFTIPLSSIISIYYFALIAYKSDTILSTSVMLAVTALIIISNIATFYLLERQIKLQSSEDMLRNLEKHYRLQTEYYTELKQNMLISDKTAHDIKNFVAAVTAYIDSGKIDLAAEKLEEFVGKMPAIKRMDTGNDAVNALIQSKLAVINAEIPDNHLSVLLPEKLKTDEMDLCILIGNALDNAIEACKKIEDVAARTLNVKIFPANDQISMLFENTKTGDTPKVGGRFKTSKAAAHMHGFGIENMKNICSKYGGKIDFAQTDKRFFVSVLLPN